MRAITRKGKGLARYGAIVKIFFQTFSPHQKKVQLEHEQHCKFGAGQSPEEGCHDSYLAITGRNRLTVVLLFCPPFSGPSRISLISAFLFESKLKMLKPLPKSHFFPRSHPPSSRDTELLRSAPTRTSTAEARRAQFAALAAAVDLGIIGAYGNDAEGDAHCHWVVSHTVSHTDTVTRWHTHTHTVFSHVTPDSRGACSKLPSNIRRHHTWWCLIKLLKLMRLSIGRIWCVSFAEWNLASLWMLEVF